MPPTSPPPDDPSNWLRATDVHEEHQSRFRIAQFVRYSVLLLVVTKTLSYIHWHKYGPFAAEFVFVILITIPSLVVVFGLYFVFKGPLSRRNRVRRIIFWPVLTLTIILSVAALIGFHAPVSHYSGNPGNTTYLNLCNGEFTIEIDRSGETRHMIQHGAPGYWRVQAPFGILLIVLAPLTILLLLDGLHQRFEWMRPPGPYPTCRNCGYNLTGNTSGICPECGVKIAAGI